MIVKDGEGASKFIEIKVSGAKSTSEAKKAALAVANSNLFKRYTSVAGRSLSWLDDQTSLNMIEA